MHGLMEIKKLNARTAKPMQNTYGGEPTNPPHVDHGILAGSGVIGTGGATPAGTLLRAQNGDGLRAVPAPPYDGRKAWYGEYREVTAKGTTWHRVVNDHAASIIYVDPDHALNAAEYVRTNRIEKAFH